MYPPTTICIPVHNALPYLQDCLKSIELNTPKYELVLVNDFSDEQTRMFLAEYVTSHPALLHNTPKQKWFTRASNIALSYSRTDFAVLLNSDTYVHEGWLDELHGVYEEYSRLTGRHVALVGSVQSFDCPQRWNETRKGVQPDYVTGHCWLCYMPAFRHLAEARGTPGKYLNELDAAQIHIASDRIGCWDFNSLGYVTLISWKARIDHHGFKSWGGLIGQIPHRCSDVD